MSPFSLLVRSSVGQGAEWVIGASVDHLVPFTHPICLSQLLPAGGQSQNQAVDVVCILGETQSILNEDPLVYIGVQVNSSGERLQIDIFSLFFKGIVIK